MEKLKVYFRENGLSDTEIVIFSTDTCHSYGYIFQINKDFKIDSYTKHFYGYYLDLTDKKILNLKQFKVEIFE
jgi:hypothetical protein